MAEIILAEQTLEFMKNSNDDIYCAILGDYVIELTAGETYTVLWDDKTYVRDAESTSYNGIDIVFIGNSGIEGIGENTEEPFVVVYAESHSLSAVETLDTAATHTMAIYAGVLEEETIGANIVLYDRNGNPVTYEGIETVTFNTDKDGKTATYTHGKAVDEEAVTLDLSKGNQTVTPADGDFMKKAVIQKPEGLLPENIKKGVEIAGVEGEMVGTGVSKEVELNLAEGDQTVTPDVDTLLSEVIVKKPETLVPENIANGVDVAGVVGTLKKGFDTTDPMLKYFTYVVDGENETVTLYSILYANLYADNGSYDVTIPDTLGGYTTVIKSN